MAIKATPSHDYPFILVSEEIQAFRSHKSAIRELKKQWAAQEPAERVGYFIAKVESYVEPDYEVKAHEEPINGDGDGGGDGGNGDGGNGNGGKNGGNGDGGKPR